MEQKTVHSIQTLLGPPGPAQVHVTCHSPMSPQVACGYVTLNLHRYETQKHTHTNTVLFLFIPSSLQGISRDMGNEALYLSQITLWILFVCFCGQHEGS
jgi:hypothetical protein